MNSQERQSSSSSQIVTDAENEHFHLAESLIAWMEHFKTTREDDPNRALSSILSSATSRLHQTSPPIVAWNLVNIFGRRQNCEKLLTALSTLEYKDEFYSDSEPGQDEKSSSENSTDSIPNLASFMLARSEFLGTDNDELILLKDMCLHHRTDDLRIGVEAKDERIPQRDNPSLLKDHQQASSTTNPLTFNSIERAVIYANFVSDYLVDLVRRKPALVQSSGATPLTKVINNSLMDLEPILQSEVLSTEQRRIIHATLLKCCNCDALDCNSRLSLARLFAESNSLKNKPLLVVEMLQSIGQFLRDPKILVSMVEILADLYSSITGHYEGVCKCFCLSAVQLDAYLNSCIRERSPIALMIYYETQLNLLSTEQKFIECVETISAGSVSTAAATITTDQSFQSRAQLWPGYLFWLSRLIHRLEGRSSSTPLVSNSAWKVTTILVRLLVMLESDLEDFILSDSRAATHSVADNVSTQLVNVGITESMSGDNLSALEHQTKPDSHDMIGATTNNLLISGNAASGVPSRSSAAPRAIISNLLNGHKCLLGFIKQLISFYDSINSGGLWSYLKSSNKSEQTLKISITSLAVACFLADRSLLQIDNLSKSKLDLPAHLDILRDELIKLRRVCLTKLEAARRSKSLIDCSQFIDSFIESLQQNNKVQYSDLVQLISTFVYAR